MVGVSSRTTSVLVDSNHSSSNKYLVLTVQSDLFPTLQRSKARMKDILARYNAVGAWRDLDLASYVLQSGPLSLQRITLKLWIDGYSSVAFPRPPGCLSSLFSIVNCTSNPTLPLRPILGVHASSRLIQCQECGPNTSNSQPVTPQRILVAQATKFQPYCLAISAVMCSYLAGCRPTNASETWEEPTGAKTGYRSNRKNKLLRECYD